MINLILTPTNATVEMTFTEYEPHFNYLVKNTRTPTYIATKYPDLFYYKDKTILLDTLKNTRRILSALVGVAIKDINVITFPKTLISPEAKTFLPIFTIKKSTPVNIPNNSLFLDYLPSLKTASKIITCQEVFTYFAAMYKIPCLTFASEWNANNYKKYPWIKIIQGYTKDKNAVIEEFLTF